MIGAANLRDFRRHNYGYTLSEFVEFVGWFLRLLKSNMQSEMHLWFKLKLSDFNEVVPKYP